MDEVYMGYIVYHDDDNEHVWEYLVIISSTLEIAERYVEEHISETFMHQMTLEEYGNAYPKYNVRTIATE